MPKCKECGAQVDGFLNLSNGICKSCIAKKNPTCKSCSKHFPPSELNDGICTICTSTANQERHVLAEKKANKIIFITNDKFSGKQVVKTLGLARGATVRAKNVGRDFLADVKNIVGGEIKGYSELMAEAREEAIYRMRLDAAKMGANAIICARFSSSMIRVGAVEIMAYGTAVVVEDE